MPDHLHDLTLGGALADHARSRPHALATVCGDARHTYGELAERVAMLASALSAAGVGRGDRVLWLGQNCHRVLEGLLACGSLGAVFCPANWRQSAEEVVTLLGDARPRVVIWQEEEIGPTVAEARARFEQRAADAPSGRDAGPGATGFEILWVRHDSPAGDPDGYEALLASGEPLAAGEPPAGEVDPADAVLMLYTAAFGGRPNGSLLSHSAVHAQGLMVAMVQQITPETVYLNSGPMFHMATLMTTFATLVMGGNNVMIPRVDAEDLCRVIEAERCNYGFVMGPTAGQILEVNADGRYDLSSLRTFGGSERWNAMVQVDQSPWGRHPAGYGQTEVTGMLTFNALGVGSKGTSGRTSPLAQVRIVDPDGAEVAPGETGEIVARGIIVHNGYHDRDELNGTRFRGGWWHTGDLGRREADGSITFVAPLTRIVKSAAENIYPAEVEGCLTSHPAVKEAAIIGVPDPKWTQRVVAVVALEPGASAGEDELIEHCRRHIASYKKPSRIEFVEKLPRQGWAIDYDTLDASYGGGGYPGSGTAF